MLFSLLSQELQFDPDNNVHYLEVAPLKIDVGKYTLVFEVIAHCIILLFFVMY
jgi:hypothetical protein